MPGRQIQIKPHAIILFGAPCSGKTTFAEKFSKQFNAPYLDYSTLDAPEEYRRKMFLTILEHVTKSRQALVIEGGADTLVDRKEIKDLLEKCDYAPAVAWIQTDITTIKKRLTQKLKDPTAAKNEYAEAVETLEAPGEKEKPIILSGKHTFSAQLKTLLSKLSNV
jgi:shikimate kinase